VQKTFLFLSEAAILKIIAHQVENGAQQRLPSMLLNERLIGRMKDGFG
jgi:hypothetical protein